MPQRPSREAALAAVRTLIQYIGDDPDRAGLVGTPDRVIRAWEQDWGTGYDPEPAYKAIARGMFDQDDPSYTGIVTVRKLSFFSHCEHHLCPFYGTVDIGYIPGKSVLGLSKFARIVDLESRLLMTQERMTEMIARHVLAATAGPHCAVVVRGTHLCMLSRGVRQPISETVTSSMKGAFYDDQSTRSEFLRIVGV